MVECEVFRSDGCSGKMSSRMGRYCGFQGKGKMNICWPILLLAVLFSAPGPFPTWGLPVSQYKIHLLKSRSVSSDTWQINPAEVARAQCRFQSPSGQVTSFSRWGGDLSRQIAGTSVLVAGSSPGTTQSSLISLWTAGRFEEAKVLSYSYLRGSEDPLIHRFLMEYELSSGTVANARFHFGRSEFSGTDWGKNLLRVIWAEILSLEWLDWGKVLLLISLLALIFSQGGKLFRELRNPYGKSAS